MATNVTTAVFGESCNTATASPSLVQWDKGQVLQISGLDLPDAYQVEFSTVYTRNAIPRVGDASGVEVPNELLQRSAPITAYIVLHGATDSRETEYWVTIHITPRTPPETTTPDPEQEDALDQAIAALEAGAEKAEAAAEAIQDMDVEAETLAEGSAASVEKTVDPDTGAVTLNFGIPKGEKGNPGKPGADGTTPNFRIGTVTTLPPESPAEATITGTKEAPALNLGIPQGKKGEPGQGGGAVESVNGKTGAVVLNASDVGALPDNYQAPVRSVAGKTGAVTLGAGDVGYSESETYQSGTVGYEVSELSRQISDVEENQIPELKNAISQIEGAIGAGMSMTAVNLLGTVLTECVYGSDQSTNIALLIKELKKVKPVSIAAALSSESRALVGTPYGDLEFVVTATFDDESTEILSDYIVTSSGSVISGTNTVTIKSRDLTTSATFEAENVTTYSISYNLTDVSASNTPAVIESGERYQTVLSVADEDHYIKTVSVTMGGVDITSTAYVNGVITIGEVTGNVIITAVGEQYQYLDPLIDARGSNYSVLYFYSDNGQTQTGRINYSGRRLISQYPAKADCQIHYKVTNTSQETLTGFTVHFGGVPSLISTPHINYTENSLWYEVTVTNASQTLASGSSIEGDFTVKAGYQVGFSCLDSHLASLNVVLRGSFVADTFEDYNVTFSTDSLPQYGAYRRVEYVDKDNALLMAVNCFKTLISNSLEPGEYDAVVMTQDEQSTCVAGMVSTDTDATATGSIGTEYNTSAGIWYNAGTLVVTQERPNFITNKSTGKTIKLKKKAT